jgi:Na+-transporting NADH:ubiquinone oxidoreductase subunit C
MAKETTNRTLLVAGLLAVVCSAFVSITAVALRPAQIRNKDLDRKKNILQAAGLYREGESIDAMFGQFEIRLVDLKTGEFNDQIDAVSFDQRRAAKAPQTSIEIAGGDDFAGIKRRSRYAPVYIARGTDGELEQLILPVHGKGLWSTLYGYMALDADLSTINGFAFYQHGETPGLGGEVDNSRWKAQWVGKQAFGPDGARKIEVLKGKVDPAGSDAQYQVDGLAGATITTRGVSGLLKYWLGEGGFEPLIERLRATGETPGEAAGEAEPNEEKKGGTDG